MKARLGIDIGGTGISAVMLDPAGQVLAKCATLSPASEGGDAMVQAVRRVSVEAIAQSGATPISAGVGAAGVIDAHGVVRVASDSFSGWQGYHLGANLQRALSMPVSIGNDVAAFVLAEQFYGAGYGHPNFFGITLGTGVGGGLVLGGRLFTGEHGAAAEIGHIPGFGERLCTCGRLGHLETLASGRSVAARYYEMTGSPLTAQQVAQAARQGDGAAQQIFQEAGEGLAQAALVVSGLLDLSAFVIGGGLARSWDLLEPVIGATLEEIPPISGHPVKILPSELGSEAVAIGAALFPAQAESVAA